LKAIYKKQNIYYGLLLDLILSFNDPVSNINPDIMQPIPHKLVYITLKDNKILSKSDKPDSEAS
jgi:hypothetical protein